MSYKNNGKKDKSNSIIDLTKPKKGKWEKYMCEFPKEKQFPNHVVPIDISQYKNSDYYWLNKTGQGKPPKGDYTLVKCLADSLVPLNNPDQGCTSSFRIIARQGKPEYAVIPMPSGRNITIGVHVDAINDDCDGPFASAVLERTIDGRTEAAAPTMRIGTVIPLAKGITLKVMDIDSDSQGRYVDILIEFPGKRDSKGAIALAKVMVQTITVQTSAQGEKEFVSVKEKVLKSF